LKVAKEIREQLAEADALEKAANALPRTPGAVNKYHQALDTLRTLGWHSGICGRENPPIKRSQLVGGHWYWKAKA
jgi:hypothetical protein